MDLPAAAVTLRDLADRRRSCRRFLPTPPPAELVASVVAIAGRAPSWSNTQPWKLFIGRPETTRRYSEALLDHVLARGERLPDIATPHAYDGPFDDRRRATGHGLYALLGIAREDRQARKDQLLENFRLFGAPQVMIVTTPAVLGTYGAIDCGGFINALLMAFEAHGLGAIAQGALAEYSPLARRFFAIPEDRHVVCGIAFGHADPDAPVNAFRTARATAEDIAVTV